MAAYVQASIKPFDSTGGTFEGVFRLEKGMINTVAPASELRRAGFEAIGTTTCALIDSTIGEYEFAVARIEFMDVITAGRVIFGPEGSEPILGLTALECVGAVRFSKGLVLRPRAPRNSFPPFALTPAHAVSL
jgi:hypothetical protein